MRRRVELRDMRSLERPRLFGIFPPLDPGERLPRELVQEGRRHRWLERRRVLGFLGAGYLPALFLVVVVLVSVGVNAVLSFGVAGLLLAAVCVVALRAPTG
jgi:hypothetical protein